MLRWLPLLLAIGLSACETPYQAYTTGTLFDTRGGYRQARLSPDSFYIWFTGNRFTTEDLAKAYALLRASELTISNGHEHFVIRRGPGELDPYDVLVPGVTAFIPERLRETPPQRLSSVEPSVEMIIDTGPGPAPKDEPFAFDACTLLWQLRDLLWQQVAGSCPVGAAAIKTPNV